MHEALVQLFHKVNNSLIDKRLKGCEIRHGIDASNRFLQHAVETLILGREETWEDLTLGHWKNDMVKVRLKSKHNVSSPELSTHASTFTCLQQRMVHSVYFLNFRSLTNRDHVGAEADEIAIFFVKINVNLMWLSRPHPVGSWDICQLGENWPRNMA